MDDMEVDAIGGETYGIELPESREIHYKIKIAVVELAIEDVDGLTTENLSMKEAKRLYERCMERL